MMIFALVFLFLFKLRFPRGTSVSRILERRYGRQGLLNFRQLDKVNLKLKKNECDLKFLQLCKAYEIVPRFLNFKLYNRGLLNSKLYKKWQFKLLNIEINSKKKSIQKLKRDLQNLGDKLYESVSIVDFYYLKSLILKNTSNAVVNIKRVHEKKLNNLGISNSIKSLDPEKVIFNLSNRILSTKEESLLAFGLNFKLPHFKVNYYKYFLSLEKLYSVLSKENQFNVQNQPTLKSCLHDVAQKLFYNFKPYKVFSPVFTKNDINILRNLAKDDSIIICRPDKGNGVVILNKDDYLNKMSTILNDRTKFRRVSTTNPLLHTLRVEDKINYQIRKLKTKGVILNELAPTLSASGTAPGIMYGLPKVHKEGAPLRPILSANNTTSYNLAKFLVSKLTPLTTNEYTLKNSYEFANYIKTIRNSNRLIMCSFDVESLFTNIPLCETIDIIISKLYPNQDSVYEGLSKAQFKDLLHVATHTSTFFFNGTLYEQIDGVAMGSPCGPTLANAFLCHYEKIWLDDCPTNFKPVAYKRYVDDTFLMFQDPSHVDQFLQYINNKHPNINFTKEVENDGALSFLDVQILKNLESGQLETSVYRKKTFTGLSSNFFSCEPLMYKINAIKTLVCRGYHLCSSFTNFHIENNFLVKFFHNNSYPKQLIFKEIKIFLNKLYHHDPSNITVPKKMIYISFPYFGYISEKLKNEIHLLVDKRFPHLNLRLAFRNDFSVGSLFRHKERLEPSLCSSLIYEYNCPLCNECYIGSTVRQYGCRISEHRGVSVRTNAPLGKQPNSAIYDHSFETGHRILTSSFKILDKCREASQLRTLEALYICRKIPTLNSGLPVELSVARLG